MRRAGPPAPQNPLPAPAARAALAAACAAIERAFGAAAIHARHRQAAKAALRSVADGLSAAAAHALARRYGDLADVLPEDLAAALRAVETRLAQERTLHRRCAAGAWYLRPSRTRLAVLTEARLILRWLRRHGHAAHFVPARAALTAPAWTDAAAE
jgi:hypothetical protein